MSNTISTINYAVTIELRNDGQDNANIGMSGGTIRYVSGGLDISSGYTYEDTTPVTDTFYSDIIKLDGFGKMGSQIDLTQGGNYAYNQTFSLTLANITQTGDPYHVALDTEDTYVMGGIVKVYAILDGVLYNRWSGVVAGVSFTSEKFIWECKDAYMSAGNTVNNTAYGLIKDLPLVIEVDEEIIATTSVPVNRVRLDKHDDLHDRVPVTTDPNSVVPYNTPMADENQADANGVQYSIRRLLPVNDDGQYDDIQQELYRWEHYTAQADTNYFQIWLDYDANIDLNEMVYIGIGTDSEEPTIKYLIEKFDTIADQYANGIYRVLVKGNPPIQEFDDQFGSYDHIKDDTAAYTSLSTFNGTTAYLYNTGVKLADGIDPDSIDVIVDKDGNQISSDVITKINGTYYIPFNIITYSVNPITNNKIRFKYSKELANPDINSSYNQYTGKISPTTDTKVTNLAIDTSDIAMNIDAYDNVYLGADILKEEKKASFKGRVDGWTSGYNGIFQFLLGADYKLLEKWTDTDGGYNAQTDAPMPSGLELFPTLSNQMNFDIIPVFETQSGFVYNTNGTPVEMSVPLAQKVTDIELQNTGGAEALSYITIDQIASTNVDRSQYEVSPDYSTTFTNNGIGLSTTAQTDTRGRNDDDDVAYIRELDILDRADGDPGRGSTSDVSGLLKSNRTLFADVYGEKSEGTLVQNYYGPTDDSGQYQDFNPQPIENVPAFIDFYLVGKNVNTADQLFGKYEDSGVDGTDTIGKLIGELADVTGYEDIRPTYYVGGYINEQRDKYSIISELCRTSFIGGYTNRKGESIFKRLFFGEFDNDNAVIHDNDIVLDKSILDNNFKQSPTSQVYNEFEIKFNYDSDGKPQSILSISNVDQEEFPDKYEFVRVMDNDQLRVTFTRPDTGSAWELLPFDVVYSPGTLPDDIKVGDVVSVDLDIDYNLLGVVFTMLGEFKGYISAIGGDTLTFGYELEEGDWTNSSTGTDVNVLFNQTTSLYKDYGDAEWTKWCKGFTSNQYDLARELWTLLREGYLRTGVINKCPANRTDLKFAVDLNYFNDTTSEDSTLEYAFDYLNNLIEWSIYQKFSVNYSLPITEETLKLELLDDVKFYDPLITPATYRTDYGKAWITKYELDPKNDKVNLTIMFEPNDLNPEAGAPIVARNGFYPFTRDNNAYANRCSDIVELPTNTDIIIEDVTNTDIIVEGECPNQ